MAGIRLRAIEAMFSFNTNVLGKKRTSKVMVISLSFLSTHHWSVLYLRSAENLTTPLTKSSLPSLWIFCNVSLDMPSESFGKVLLRLQMDSFWRCFCFGPQHLLFFRLPWLQMPRHDLLTLLKLQNGLFDVQHIFFCLGVRWKQRHLLRVL